MQKYRPLGDYLVKQHEVTVFLAFQRIEQILGFALPPSAYSHRAWWANSLLHPQAGSWLNVGWKVGKVNMEAMTVLMVRPLVLSMRKVIDEGDVLSLMATMDSENLTLILSGPNASANTVYSWRQIIQILVDVNPHMFGNLTRQPGHHIFAEMLAKLGYTVVNWETNESWKACPTKDVVATDVTI